MHAAPVQPPAGWTWPVLWARSSSRLCGGKPSRLHIHSILLLSGLVFMSTRLWRLGAVWRASESS